MNGEKQIISIGGHRFEFICDLIPLRNEDGSIVELMPQDRYRNDRGLRLNNYGQGPFCKFKIPTKLFRCGVYSILVDGEIKYIGECQNLSDRYNMGYGNISPRNCFVGGQETNCRINNLIFRAREKGENVTLWFLPTDDYKEIEYELRVLLKPSWNLA